MSRPITWTLRVRIWIAWCTWQMTTGTGPGTTKVFLHWYYYGVEDDEDYDDDPKYEGLLDYPLDSSPGDLASHGKSSRRKKGTGYGSSRGHGNRRRSYSTGSGKRSRAFGRDKQGGRDGRGAAHSGGKQGKG
eukprot:7377380-Pyramimonas_sp.AAC.1